MSIEPSSKGTIRGHLFTVDILIENNSNGRALERLLRLLNSPDVKDYRINSGIELGTTIEAALQAEKEREPSRKDPVKKSPELHASIASTDKSGANTAASKPAAAKADAKPTGVATKSGGSQYSSLIAEIERYKANNTLVRLTFMKGQGIKLSMPCRILNYDPSTENVSVYHVDEKKVYLFRLNEIDELQTG